MVNIENELYTEVATALRTSYPSISIYGDETRVPSSFPCVSFYEADNYTFMGGYDSAGEKFATVMYEVNVYSNSLNGKKTEAKDIMSIVDGVMMKRGFTRMMKNSIVMDDATIYRLVCRYTANVSNNETIYRR